MSVIPADVHQQLNQLLHGLQAPDNVLRTQAEENLNTQWVSLRPEILLMGLVEHLQGAEDPAVRAYPVIHAAVTANVIVGILC